MHDLIPGLAVLPVLAAVIAMARAASRARRLPRHYTGGIHAFDWPPDDQWRQR